MRGVCEQGAPQPLCPSPYPLTHTACLQRRAAGDLLYVRIATLDGGVVLHVTATSTGWFVNRTTDAVFDPAPAVSAPAASATLWALLHRASPAFRRNYQAVRARTKGVGRARE